MVRLFQLDKVVRASIWASACLMVMCLLGTMVSAYAAKEKTTQEISKESFKTLDKQVIKNIQGSLKVLGYEQDGLDGTVGPKTIVGLKRFASDFKVKQTEFYAQKVAELVLYYGVIATVFPDWQQITKSKDFQQWLSKEPPAKQKIIDNIGKVGTAQQVIAILRSYTTNKKKVSPGQGKDTGKDTGAQELAYEAEGEIIAQLGQLEKATKENEQKFLDEFDKILIQVPYQYRQFIKLMIQQAQHVLEYPEADRSCQDISDQDIPVNFLTPLLMLQNQKVVCVYKSLISNVLARKQHDEDVAPRQAELLEQAKQLQQFDQNQAPPIDWSGECNGCAQDSSKVVYGLYPFWMATGKLQEINFSVLSRIGYFALTFDENGQIEQPIHWQKKRPHADFINEAHKYRTKMDLVIFNDEWDQWSKYTVEETTVVIDKLTTNIVKLVSEKLNNYPINALKPYVSFGFSPTRTMGDGVTIDFDFESMKGKEPEEMFSSLYVLVNQLREKLKQAGDHYFLNLMVPMRSLFKQEGVYTLDNMNKLTNDVDLILVSLEEPIRPHMDQLRQKIIDRKFTSQEERTLLRKIVPVISPSHQKDELEEIVAYFEDNFGGVGFWPIPLSQKGKEYVGTQVIRKEFSFTEEGPVCQFVCPHRWALRIGIDLVLVFSLGYMLLSLWIYDLRRLAKQYTSYVLGGILVAAALLVLTFWCDPFWKDRQADLLFVTLVLATATVIWVTSKKKREADYP